MTRRFWTCKLAIIALLTGTSLAQPPQGNGPDREQPRQHPTVDQIFQQMDANRDKKLGKTEVKGPLQQDFSQLDTDGDGFLSEQEVKNGSERKPPQR